MSDQPKSIEEQLKDFTQNLAKDNERADRKKAIDEKALSLKEHRVNIEFDTLQKNQKELEEAKTLRYGELSDAEIKKLMDDNDEYMEAAKHAMKFVVESFKGAIPFFRKNLLVIAGDTGNGKSTTVANIVSGTIVQRNPLTGKLARCLILTNEEAPEDFYNRITCHFRGWNYVNHDQFTDEQRKTFTESIAAYAKGGRLTVIGDTYQGVSGCTTTVEGMSAIFESLMKNGDIYDVVLIDYYQNVRSSKNNPKLNEFECQREFASVLDRLKIIYPGVIVVMAQIKKLHDEEDTTPFTVRLKGSKLLFDKATFVTELVPERENLRTKWIVWKSRFTDVIGKSLYTGYDRGKFVDWEGNREFQEKVAKLRLERATKDAMENMPPNVLNKEKKDGS